MLEHRVSLQAGALGKTLLVDALLGPIANRFRLPFRASAFAAVILFVPCVLMFQAVSAALDVVDLGFKENPASLLPIVANEATAVILRVALPDGMILLRMDFDAVTYRR